MVHDAATVTIANRYVLHEKLGRGGMGSVYRAFDRLTGNFVALKRVVTSESLGSTTDSQSSRLALTNEFQTLASLRHPHIINVLDYGFDEQRQPYFTMTLLDGARTIVEVGQGLTVVEKVNLLVQMLQALAYLHRRGVLHCDLKPENALVVSSAGGGNTVKVLDFGLAAHENRAKQDERVAGTLAYIAPEVLRGETPTIAADLYAVGLIAYEIFVGEHPFDLNNINRLLYQIMVDEPDLSSLKNTEIVMDFHNQRETRVDLDSVEALHTHDIKIASDEVLNARLASILESLLAKEAFQRPHSAEETIQALCEAVNQPVPEETPAIRESFLQAAQFVGRDAELNHLLTALQDAVSGRGGVLLVAGESGVGKSRLLDELRIRALVDGALVLRGVAVSEGGKPYQVWREPLRRLLLNIPLDDADAGALKVLVPDVEALLGRTVPDLPEADAASVHQQVVATVTSVFNRNKQITVLLAEDLHWAGGESLALLRQIGQVAPDLPLLVIASFREEERPKLPEELGVNNILRLRRLDREGVARLSEAMLGSAGRRNEVVSLLHRETEGNVFFLIEVVRALAEEAGDRQHVGQMTLPQTIFAGGVRRIAQRRLERAGERALPLLRLAAVAGRRLDLDALRHILTVTGDDLDFDAWLTDCANAAVIDIQDEHWQFAHDKLREALLADLIDVERAALHRQVAEALEALYPDDAAHVTALVNHWAAAGESYAHKECHYAALAGEQMIRISAYNDGILYCQRALQLTEQLGGEVQQRAKLKRLLGTAHARLDDFSQAEGDLAESIALSIDDLSERVQGMIELAELLRLRGGFSAAAEILNEALKLAREMDQAGVLAAVLMALGAVEFSRGDHRAARGYLNESFALAEQTGDLLTKARSMQVLATIDGVEGHSGAFELFEVAIDRLEKTVALFVQLGNRDFAARNQVNLGEILRLVGRIDEARATFHKAIQMLLEVGALGGLTVPYSSLSEIELSQKNFSGARDYLCSALRYSARIGEAPYTMMMLGSVAKYLAATGNNKDALMLLAYVSANPNTFEHTARIAEIDIQQISSTLSSAEVKQLMESGKQKEFNTLINVVAQLLNCVEMFSPHLRK